MDRPFGSAHHDHQCMVPLNMFFSEQEEGGHLDFVAFSI